MSPQNTAGNDEPLAGILRCVGLQPFQVGTAVNVRKVFSDDPTWRRDQISDFDKIRVVRKVEEEAIGQLSGLAHRAPTVDGQDQLAAEFRAARGLRPLREGVEA